MMRILAVVAVLLSLAGSAWAVPTEEAEYGAVPIKECQPTGDQYHFAYYNICSGWVVQHHGYCFQSFHSAPLAPMYGTCFDLKDCPADCRHLEDVWWACKVFHLRGHVDVEVYAADANCCPVGDPLAGIYSCSLNFGDPWQHFQFGGVPLCALEGPAGADKFIVMITDTAHEEYHEVPYSDINPYNIKGGCEPDWRCAGHSFVYRNSVSYCDVYGQPGAMWISGPAYGCRSYLPVPPGCHNYFYSTGFFAEWLIHCYLACQGPTETQKETWSGVKGLYR